MRGLLLQAQAEERREGRRFEGVRDEDERSEAAELMAEEERGCEERLEQQRREDEEQAEGEPGPRVDVRLHVEPVIPRRHAIWACLRGVSPIAARMPSRSSEAISNRIRERSFDPVWPGYRSGRC